MRCLTRFPIVAFLSLLPATALGDAPAATSPAVSPAITVYRNPARYCTFPDVKRLPDGRLICVFRDAPYPDQIRHVEVGARAVGSISSDHGRTWSEPFVIHEQRDCLNDPSVAVLRNGELLVNFFIWQGVDEAFLDEHKPSIALKVLRGEWGSHAVCRGVHLVRGTMRDGDIAWTPEARHLVGTLQSMRATSASILETRDGTLLLPHYGRSPGRKSDEAFVLRSRDGGQTWEPEIRIALDPEEKVGMQEPALAQNERGEIVCLLRTTEKEDRLYLSISPDDGKTWSPAHPTELVGHPADMEPLPGGRMLAVYGYRHKPYGVRACVSRDGGRTWDRSREIVLADNGHTTDLGYPSPCVTDDGHVLVVYYMNNAGTKDRWIEARRVPLSMLE